MVPANLDNTNFRKFWIPISNMMNTHAYKGKGPITSNDIWTSIVADTLLCGGVNIPAVSFLCNRAIEDWLDDPARRPILDWFMESEKLIIVSYGARSFEELADILIEKESHALEGKRPETIAKLGKRLDTIYPDSLTKFCIDQSAFAAAKNSTSTSIIRDNIHLHYSRDAITKEAKETRENGGVLDGTWWSSLPDKSEKLAYLSSVCHSIGPAMFDLALAGSMGKLLTGHTYGKDIVTFRELMQPLIPRGLVALTPTVLDEYRENVDRAVFVRNIIDNITVRHLEIIEKDESIGSTFSKYIESLETLHERHDGKLLPKVKSDFDKYLNTLGAYIRTTSMVKYLEDLKKRQYLVSKLRLCVVGKEVVSILKIFKREFAMLTSPIEHYIAKKEQRIRELEEEIENARPLPFTAMTSVSEMEDAQLEGG